MDIHALTTPISRRRFITVAGAGTALAVVDSRGFLQGPLVANGDELTVTLVRPDDQLRLQFDFINLEHDVAGNRLVSSGPVPARVRIGLPSQHVAETAITASDTPPGRAGAPIAHRAAAASRLVFNVAPPIDLTVDALLGLTSLRTTVAVGDPGDEMTMVEVPADLRWVPAGGTSVRHDTGPVSAGGVGQLHRIVLDGPFDFTPVHNASGTDPFTGRIPDAGARDEIVGAADADGPATATRVWLTPNGAWADLAGDWSDISWIQNVRGGRDEFAQVVERGVLMPFGHPAVWTQTNTRVWVADADGDLVSTLVNDEHFAIAGDATVSGTGPYTPNEGREMPFVSVTAENRDAVTAEKGLIEFTDPDTGQPRTININDAWRANYSGGFIYDGYRIEVDYSAIDSVGNPPITFFLPAVFVSASALDKPGVLAALAAFYRSDEGESVRQARLYHDMAWTAPLTAGSPITTFASESIDVELETIEGVSAGDLEAAGQLPLAPRIARGVIGRDGLSGIEVRFSPVFRERGNDPDFNPEFAFLDLKTPTAFPLGQQARAVMSPDLLAEQFNQGLGIGPRLETPGGGGAAAVTWKPADAFGEAAQILRGVKFADIVADGLLDSAIAGIDIPNLVLERLADRFVQTYSWCPDSIKSVELAGFIASAETALCVELEVVVGLAAGVQASSTVNFSVTDFTLVVPPVLGVVELDVRMLQATQSTVGPPQLTFDIAEWRLGGLLQWIQPLFDLLTPAGADFDVDILDTEIALEYGITLPDIDLGVLEITGLSIALSGSFPFVGEETPRIGIGVGSADRPVKLQILQFGGGFYCSMEFSANGLELLKIGAEVSARLVEIDIVIAEAYCEVAIAAEFKLKGDDVTFTGKLRLTASFSAGGIIEASLSIEGKVKYESALELITISGTIYWSVTAGLSFEGSVPIGSFVFRLGDSGPSLPVTQAARSDAGRALELQGAPGGESIAGSFGSVHTFATWNQYVDAFAPEP